MDERAEIMRMMDILEESGDFAGLSQIELARLARQMVEDMRNPPPYAPEERWRY